MELLLGDLLRENQDERCPKEKGQAKNLAKVQGTRSSNGLPVYNVYIVLKPILCTTLNSCCPKVWWHRDLIFSKQVVSFLIGEVVKSLFHSSIEKKEGGVLFCLGSLQDN